MNEEFCAHIQAMLEEAVAGQRFPNKASGGDAEPTVYRTQVPLRPGGYEEGLNPPLVVWCVIGGELSGRTTQQVEIRIDCLTWTPGSIQDGSADIARLTEAVLKITEHPGYAGHRLDWPVRFTLGEDRDMEGTAKGRQAHPMYESKIYMTFTAPRNIPRCRI